MMIDMAQLMEKLKDDGRQITSSTGIKVVDIDSNILEGYKLDLPNNQLVLTFSSSDGNGK